jgi:Mg2+/citrate symporter
MSVVYSYEAKDKKIRRIIKTFWLNLVLTTKLMSIRVLGIYSRSTIMIFY